MGLILHLQIRVIKLTEKCQVCAQLPIAECRKIRALVARGLFINQADLVRSAVRELLEKFKDE